ncbi:MAG: DUF4345 domain-containing protein [Sphingomonas sp.]|nr:DUF4345 domain-containing protein [Sphingomonas sp.]
MNRNTERRLLQVAVALACTVPLAAGAMGVAEGPAMLKEMSAGVDPDLESHFRYLSGLLLGLGLGFAASIPSIERRSEVFLALSGLVVIGGLARLFAVADAGAPTIALQLALVMELVVVPLLFAWQRRIAWLFRS